MADVLVAQAPAEQFHDLVQQREAATFGMWVFLVTELMLFGGLFTAYTAYRWVHHAAWIEGSHHMTLWAGTVNTAVLIVSSFTMALAVHAVETRGGRSAVPWLLATATLGGVFLGIKAYEYWAHAHEGLVPGPLWTYAGEHAGPLQIFFWLYFGMTGLHALHLTVGIVVVLVMAARAWRGVFAPAYATPVEVSGLYWHLVDIIWIFLFPLLYLIE
jgi:cytochrome c oxidase subunit 3